MRKPLFILLLVPVLCSAQYDFESRYFRIDAKSLPQVESLMSISFSDQPIVKRSLNEFQMNADNYRVEVEMASVINAESEFVPQPYDMEPIEAQLYGFGDNARYTPDGSTKVRNAVYKEMRGLELLDTCPPFGICPRCAPYRVGRGY